ncbi:MAG: TlyA family rRNA (cytidine-2'-O)-methyltransferase [Candidatus Sumerlaeia bacterium]
MTFSGMGERSKKIRADQLLVARNLAESRQKAQRLILAGEALCNGQRIEKPGQLLDAAAEIEIRPRRPRFVSRGGEKLDGALSAFGCDVHGLICADIGASTGGFTHCLLERGAARVYALDVGHGQLHALLRADPRVIALEGINCRYLQGREIPEKVDFIVMDVSFISILKILGGARTLLKPRGRACCLIKPQFEAGPRDVRRGGLVRDPAVQRRVLEEFCRGAAALGAKVVDLCRAPIAGTKGNQEFFALLAFGEPESMESGDADRLDQRIKDLTDDKT